jgi:hypothetical protein
VTTTATSLAVKGGRLPRGSRIGSCVPSCGKGGNPRLVCTRCKDSLMYGDEVITCGRSRGCEYVYDPPRLILSYVEPLKKGAA